MDRQQHNPMYFTNGQCVILRWLSRFSFKCARCMSNPPANTHRTHALADACAHLLLFCESPLSHSFVCALVGIARRAHSIQPRRTHVFDFRFIIDWPMRTRYELASSFESTTAFLLSLSLAGRKSQFVFDFNAAKTVNCGAAAIFLLFS